MHRSHSPPTHPTLPGLWLPVYLFNAVIYREVSGQSVTVSATATPTSTADADSDLDSNSGGCEYDGSVTDYLSCAKDKISTTTLIGAGIGVTLGIFALAFLCIWLTKRKRISAANQTSIGQRRSPTDFEDLEGRRKSNYLVPEITWDGASEKGQDVEDDQRTGSDTKKGRSSAIPPVPPILDLKRSNTQRSHHATATQKDRLRHDSSQSATSQNFHPQQATTRDPTAPQAEDATSMSEEGTHTSMVRKPSRRIPPPSILKDGTGVGATQDRSSALSHSRSLSDTPTPSVSRPEAAHLRANTIKRPETEYLQVPNVRDTRRPQTQMRRPSTVHTHTQPPPLRAQDQNKELGAPVGGSAMTLQDAQIHKPLSPQAQARPIPFGRVAMPQQNAAGADPTIPLISRSGSPIPPISPRTLFVSNASDPSSSRVSSVFAPSVAASSISSSTSGGWTLPLDQITDQPSIPTRAATDRPPAQRRDQTHTPKAINRSTTGSSNITTTAPVAKSHPPVAVPVPKLHGGRSLPLRGVSTSAVRPVSSASSASLTLPTPRFPNTTSSIKQLRGNPEVLRSVLADSEANRSRTPSPAKQGTARIGVPARPTQVTQAAVSLQAPADSVKRTPSPAPSTSSISSRRKRETMMIPLSEAQRASLMVDTHLRGRGRSSTAMPSLTDASRRSTLVVPDGEGRSRNGSVSSVSTDGRSRSPSPALSSLTRPAAHAVRSQTLPAKQASVASVKHPAQPPDEVAGPIISPPVPRTDTRTSSNRTSLLPYMNSGVTKPERSGTTPLPVQYGSHQGLQVPQRTRTETMPPTQYGGSGRTLGKF